MAAPGAQRFRIDQALHGYRQGHRWLNGSLRLEGNAEATLLALSDLLPSNLAPGQDSYLSGYPLKEANRFVLTRTWLAPESSRPGSVWSHSLLIDYAALSLIDDLTLLLGLFRRPDGATDSRYGQPVDTTELTRRSGSSGDSNVDGLDSSRALEILASLYGPNATRSRSMSSEIPSADEALTLAVWRQMWPGLRRDFAFFTRVRGEVSEVSASFSLYFRTDEFQPSASPVPDRVDSTPYEVLRRDLPKTGPTDLRRYLGRYASDAPNPRRIVPDLVSMHELGNDPAQVALSLKGRHSGASALPRLKRDILLQATHSEDPAVVTRVVRALRNEPLVVTDEELNQLLSIEICNDREAIGQIVDATSPSDFGELGDAVLRALAVRAEAHDLAAAPVDSPTRRKLLDLRPDLAAESAFWPEDSVDRVELLQHAMALTKSPAGIVAAIGRNMTSAEAGMILTHYGARAELQLFDVFRDRPADRETWTIIRELVCRPGFVQRELQQARGIGLGLLDLMIAEMSPDISLPPESWLAAWRRELGSKAVPQTAPNLACRMIIAGMSVPLSFARQLFEPAFDAVYEGLDKWSLPSHLRTQLEEHLGRRSKEWRLVDKLVAAVLDKYGGPDRADPSILMVTSRSDALRGIVDRIERKGSKGALKHFASRAEAKRQPELAPRIQLVRAEVARRDARWPW